MKSQNRPKTLISQGKQYTHQNVQLRSLQCFNALLQSRLRNGALTNSVCRKRIQGQKHIKNSFHKRMEPVRFFRRKGHTQVTRLPQQRGLRDVMGRQSSSHFILNRLVPVLEPVLCLILNDWVSCELFNLEILTSLILIYLGYRIKLKSCYHNFLIFLGLVHYNLHYLSVIEVNQS